MAVYAVITVCKSNVFSVRKGKTGLSGSGQSLVFLMQNVHLPVSGGVPVTDFGGGICRTVIDQNEFIIGQFLTKNAVQTFFQIFFCIVDRNNYAQERFV